MYTWTTQSQNTALNSWGKLGQKKYSFESLPKKKDSGGSRSQK